MIPYGRQSISEADEEAVISVLRSDYLTQGPMVPNFQNAVARYCGVKHAVAVNSATSALHVACLALDLGPGDVLWTSPNTFVATANAALYCGASVDFVDIDPDTYNLCPERLEEKLCQAEKIGKLPKIVIPVHYAGQPCDMSSIHSMGQKYGFKIIEDASHAIGAKYDGIKVGSCTHSDITVFSFHPIKIITTGEGGMLTVNCEQLARRLERLRTHGITNDANLMCERPESEIWNYQQIELGFNYRMTDIQGALGVSQMTRIDDFLNVRRRIAAKYDADLSLLRVKLPLQKPLVQSSYHLYPIRVNEMTSGKKQRQIYDALYDGGIKANLHYIPVHTHPYYEKLGFKVGDFPESERFHQEVLSLPIYPDLELSEQNRVIEVLGQALNY